MRKALEEADAPDLDPAQRLRRQLAAAMRFWLQHPDDYRIMFARKILRVCKSLAKIAGSVSGEKLLTRLTEAVDEAAKSGALRRTGHVPGDRAWDLDGDVGNGGAAARLSPILPGRRWTKPPHRGDARPHVQRPRRAGHKATVAG